VTPLLWLCDFYLFYIVWIRSKITTQEHIDNQKPIPSQRELNALFTNSDIDFSFKFSYISKTILMTLFYIPIFPMGGFLSLAGLIFAYLVDRYNLLRRYKRPEMPNEVMCEFLLDYFKVFIFVYAIGNYIFLIEVYLAKSWALAFIIMFGLLSTIPFHRWLKFSVVGMNESDIFTESYDDCYLDFYMDYERTNPITRKQGYENYINGLIKKGILTEKQAERLRKRLNDNRALNLMEIYFQNRKYTLNQIKNARFIDLT
jgi:hypothetical protein